MEKTDNKIKKTYLLAYFLTEFYKSFLKKRRDYRILRIKKKNQGFYKQL